MPLLGVLRLSLWVVVVITSVEVYLIPEAVTERGLWIPDLEMPKAWDVRYVQKSAQEGVQVCLLRKGVDPGDWLVVGPSLQVHLLCIGDRRAVRTYVQGPKAGVHYVPCPVLSNQEKARLMEESERLLTGGLVGVVRLSNAQGGMRVWLTRYLGFMVTSPAWGLKLLKWSCRSPWRFGGWVAGMWVCYEVLVYVGTFNSVHQLVESVYTTYLRMKSSLIEASEMLSEWNEIFTTAYEFIQQYVDPWKIPLGVIALFLIILWIRDLDTSVTPMVTPEASPLSSLGATPPEDPQTLALHHINSAIKTQAALMERLVEKLVVLEGKGREEEDRQKELEFVMKGRLESQSEGQKDLWVKNDRSWDDMKDRLNQFEKVLKEDRADSAGGPRQSSQKLQDLKMVNGFRSDGISKAAEGTSCLALENIPQLSGEMNVIIKKLTRDLRTPQEIFVQALKEYREEDKELWATHFPPGFRERVAPQVLGEIYATGTAKEWAKNWIKSRDLGDCDEARQVIPTCAALDSILLVDQVRDSINQVNTEKMARKVLGIRSAYKAVVKESDWKKGTAKVWKSKVDMEMWKRTDPGLEDHEHIFVNRRAEDEMRGEMDREASMLKAKLKLSERNSSS